MNGGHQMTLLLTCGAWDVLVGKKKADTIPFKKMFCQQND